MTDPTPAPSTGGWAAPPPPPPAGTAGFVYADVPNRAIAYIIDSILVGIIVSIVTGILGGMGLAAVTMDAALNVSVNFVGLIISAIVGVVISAAYFIYTWTSMRGTLGMKVLGMQIGNAGDGKALTTDQAVRRWLIIAAPSLLAQVFIVVPIIGFVLAIASIVWFFYLVYTTAKSPTKQGYHDVFANTMVVKAARTAG
jgi:uncharacterized RDD family membrane protein YckC